MLKVVLGSVTMDAERTEAPQGAWEMEWGTHNPNNCATRLTEWWCSL